MNVNPFVFAAAGELLLPCAVNFYEGDANDYIVFNYADERGIAYSDNLQMFDRATVQVHNFFKGGNAPQKKHALRKALRNQGFSVYSSAEMYEPETGYTHIIVTCIMDGAENLND